MRKALSFTVAAAALIAAGSIAGAQSDTDYDFYVSGNGDERVVTSRTSGQSTPLLMGENNARPADCPPGHFYIIHEETIVACDDAAVTFGLVPPPADLAMDDGRPFDQDTALMQPLQLPSGSTAGEGGADATGEAVGG